METPTGATPAVTPGPDPDAPDAPDTVSTAPEVHPDSYAQNDDRRSLATLTDPEREGELSGTEKLYVDYCAGRLTDGDALRRLLAFAAGCDDDAYADEQGN